MNTCQGCGTALPDRSGPGRPRKWCSGGCRPPSPVRKWAPGYVPPSRQGECSQCGATIQISHTSASSPTCRPCRSARPKSKKQHDRRTPCADCSSPSYGERCRPCAILAKVSAPPLVRSLDDHRVQRWQRDSAAPGLSAHSRSNLLAKWKRQGRSCTFCPSLADTVDHVVPLVRGGTNHEGNLVPCCRSCNSKKCARFVSEWRHGRRPQRMAGPPEWDASGRRRKPRPGKPKTWAEQAPMFNVCAGCGDAAGPRAEFCSARCAARVGYRRRVGIPDLAPLYGRGA